MHQTLFGYVTRSFSVLFQINYASLWHHRFEQDKKKEQTTEKNQPSVVFWLEKQTAASVRSFTIHKRRRRSRSKVTRAAGTAKFPAIRWDQMLHTLFPAQGNGKLGPAAGFSSAPPDDTANVVCLSLARRQTAA